MGGGIRPRRSRYAVMRGEGARRESECEKNGRNESESELEGQGREKGIRS